VILLMSAGHLRGSGLDSSVTAFSEAMSHSGISHMMGIMAASSSGCHQRCHIDFYRSGDSCCAIGENDVRFTATVCVALTLFSVPLKALFLYKRVTIPMPNPKVHRVHSLFGFFGLLYDLTYMIHGILKMISPTDFVIGNAHANPLIDVVFFINSCSFVCFLHCIALNLSQFLLGTIKIMPSACREKVSTAIDRVDNYGLVAPAFGIILSLFPFFSYGAPQYTHHFNNVYLYGFWGVQVFQSFVIFSLGTFVVWQMKSALKSNASSTVDHSETDAKITAALQAITRSRIFATTKNVLVNCSWIVFTAVPVLRQKFTYYYMLVFILTYITSLVVLKGFWNFGPPKSTVVPVSARAGVPTLSSNSKRGHHHSEDAYKASDEDGIEIKETKSNNTNVESKQKSEST
jgi:hypothetical protein